MQTSASERGTAVSRTPHMLHIAKVGLRCFVFVGKFASLYNFVMSQRPSSFDSGRGTNMRLPAGYGQMTGVYASEAKAMECEARCNAVVKFAARKQCRMAALLAQASAVPANI